MVPNSTVFLIRFLCAWGDITASMSFTRPRAILMSKIRLHPGYYLRSRWVVETRMVEGLVQVWAGLAAAQGWRKGPVSMSGAGTVHSMVRRGLRSLSPAG